MRPIPKREWDSTTRAMERRCVPPPPPPHWNLSRNARLMKQQEARNSSVRWLSPSCLSAGNQGKALHSSGSCFLSSRIWLPAAWAVIEHLAAHSNNAGCSFASIRYGLLCQMSPPSTSPPCSPLIICSSSVIVARTRTFFRWWLWHPRRALPKKPLNNGMWLFWNVSNRKPSSDVLSGPGL